MDSYGSVSVIVDSEPKTELEIEMDLVIVFSVLMNNLSFAYHSNGIFRIEKHYLYIDYSVYI